MSETETKTGMSMQQALDVVYRAGFADGRKSLAADSALRSKTRIATPEEKEVRAKNFPNSARLA